MTFDCKVIFFWNTMVDFNMAFICYIFGQFIGYWNMVKNRLFIEETMSIQEEFSLLILKTLHFLLMYLLF